jgi:hypothetical protein
MGLAGRSVRKQAVVATVEVRFIEQCFRLTVSYRCSEYLDNAVWIGYGRIDLQQSCIGRIRLEGQNMSRTAQYFRCQDRIPTDIGAQIQNGVTRSAQAAEYFGLKRLPDSVSCDIGGYELVRVGMNRELERWNSKSVRSHKPILFTVDCDDFRFQHRLCASNLIQDAFADRKRYMNNAP